MTCPDATGFTGHAGHAVIYFNRRLSSSGRSAISSLIMDSTMDF
jgi:hypothetical protein